MSISISFDDICEFNTNFLIFFGLYHFSFEIKPKSIMAGNLNSCFDYFIKKLQKTLFFIKTKLTNPNIIEGDTG